MKYNQGKEHESLPRIDFVVSDNNSKKYKKSFRQEHFTENDSFPP